MGTKLFSERGDMQHHQLKNCIENKNIRILHFAGKLSFKEVTKQINTLEQLLLEKENRKSNLRKIMKVFIELITNLYHHSVQTFEDIHYPVCFCVGTINLTHILTTSNVIRFDDSNNLKKRLDYVRSLSKDELHQSYLKSLKEGKGSRTGAGLGIMYIALKSNEPIEYDIENVSESLVRITLSVTIQNT